jgi:hypothetical protein
MKALWQSAPQDLQLLKVHLIDATGLGKDALHIYTGMALFITVRMVWRWRGGWILGWLTALAVASAIEYMDMRAAGIPGPLRPDASHWHDIWNTMFWPTVLLLLGPWLQPRPTAKAARSDGSADQPLNDRTEQPPPV